MNAIDIHVRWAIKRDLPAMLGIEYHADVPWTADDFNFILGQANCIGMIAEQGDDILGFMIYRMHERGIELVNLIVHPKSRRRGVGTTMIAKLVSRLSGDCRSHIEFEVPETDLAAQLFLRSRGFMAVRIRSGLLGESDGATYLMEYRLVGAVQPATNVWKPVNRIAALYA